MIIDPLALAHASDRVLIKSLAEMKVRLLKIDSDMANIMALNEELFEIVRLQQVRMDWLARRIDELEQR